MVWLRETKTLTSQTLAVAVDFGVSAHFSFSVALEHLFSNGYIVSDLRAQLATDNVNKLVFLAGNMLREL